ncbi:MAG: NAD(P)H-hydrate dehydratase, partial [Acidobacteriota bacterium]
DPDGLRLEERLAGFDLVIDALFGTGLSKRLEGTHSSVVQKINRSGKEVISIDVPSGLSSDTGSLPGPAVKANATIALAALKYCHLLAPASKMCGEIHVVDIGISVDSTTTVVRSGNLLQMLPHRAVDSHKGTYGHAVVIGGSQGKSGAAYLSGKGALHCGAGLVTVVCPSLIQPVIAAHGPEIMTFPADHPADVTLFLADKTAAAIGPGMGAAGDAKPLFEAVLSDFHGPLVIDADGLNHLSKDVTLVKKRKRSSTILTPHPGEMGRLLNTDTATVQEDRIRAATKLAHTTQSVVVLKGYRTVVSDPDGKVWVVPTGGQALASGGTGDVLTGIITGFLSQGLKPVEAAIAGAYLHGFTSNLFEARYPQQAMNALDILQWWNDAVHMVRSGKDVESEYLKIHFKF